MIRTKALASCLVLLAGFTEVQTAVAQERVKTPKQNSANEKQVLAKPDLSVDEARMIVKDIPSVDIRATLGTWKLSEAELGQLRQWSGILVEKPGTTEFLAKWSELIRQAHARTPQIKESSITPLIRMVMLAAYEEAQKHQTTSAASAPSEVYKQLQEQLRANLVEARQLQSLMGSERKDPLSGSRLSLPAHQRTLRKCDVIGQPKRMECKEVLVSASYELDDYISGSEAQLVKAEEEAKRGGGASESGQEKRRQMLYALSDVAKAMHDSAVAVLRKAGR
uniref:Uncharacterized protein n=1 Tax=uncultured marine bacterium PPT_M1 TaxID=1381396 RepID=A0A067XRU3_9BACT|nr:hypothetical protein PPT_M1_11 [uncultured marine bacterium PPT_M1]